MSPSVVQSGGDDVSAVVVDPGYDSVRIGNCQEDYPREYIPSVLCRGADASSNDPRSWSVLSSLKRRKFVELRRLLHLNRDGNLEVDPFVFEKLTRLGVEGHPLGNGDDRVGGLMLDPSQHPMLVVEPTAESKQFRDAVLEVLFEQFDVTAAYLAKRATLTAFSVGRASALVVDIGAGGCTVSPVHDGIALQSTIQDSLVGGNALDLQLANLLYEDGYSLFNPNTDVCQEYYRLELAKQLRENYCSLDNDNAQNGKELHINEKSDERFILPDGNVILMNKYRNIPNLLFTPELGKFAEFNQFKGIINMITDCIFDSDVDIRRELLSSIVLAGGLTLTPGLITHISSELLKSTVSNSCKFKLVHSSSYLEKRYSTWLGGSILASLGRFQQLWISKHEYQEHGTIIAYRRCH